MNTKTKMNISRLVGIFLSVIPYRSAYEFYNSGVEHETLIVSLLVCLGLSINFIAATITTSLSHSEKK